MLKRLSLFVAKPLLEGLVPTKETTISECPFTPDEIEALEAKIDADIHAQLFEKLSQS